MRDMSVFKNLLSRILRHGSMPSLRPARWHQNARAPVMEVTGARALERVSLPDHPRLPPDHPDTIRVRRVAANIITVAWNDEVFGQRRLSKRTGCVPDPYGDLKIQVNVIDCGLVQACVNISSEIFVYAGLMEHIGDNDAHIATVLGHEVGHLVAEHLMRDVFKGLGVSLLVNFVHELLDVPGEKIEPEAWRSLFMRPWYFGSELETDRIGLLLQSAAGYDPRVAPAFILKLGLLLEEDSDEQDDDLDATHPSSKKRAQALSRPEIMDEALELYNIVSARVMQTSQLPPPPPPSYHHFWSFSGGCDPGGRLFMASNLIIHNQRNQ